MMRQIVAILPVKNKADVLEQCLDSVSRAATARPGTRVVVVDNGSTDGSLEIARQFDATVTLVHSLATRVGAVRNDGVRSAGDADVLAFIDCDCIVPPDFFHALDELFSNEEFAAVGCEVVAPSGGHWTEVVGDALYRRGGDGYRQYINSACFCIRSEWFARINGFDEQKISSEDVDICRRLRLAGGVLWQSERLAVVHLGNPKSIVGVYARLLWHARGIYEPNKGIQWSVTTIGTILHFLSLVLALVVGVSALYRRAWWELLVPVALVLWIPAGFVVARAIEHRRMVPPIRGTVLMLVTMQARVHGVLKSVLSS
jgi:glycosyltransferase involved in cell wall biosynthesis